MIEEFGKLNVVLLLEEDYVQTISDNVSSGIIALILDVFVVPILLLVPFPVQREAFKVLIEEDLKSCVVLSGE